MNAPVMNVNAWNRMSAIRNLTPCITSSLYSRLEKWRRKILHREYEFQPADLKYIGKGHPATSRVGPRGSGYVKAPDFLDVRHYEGGRSSVLRAGRLYPRINPWYSFLEAESTPGHMVLSVATEKIPTDNTGNRSRDRPTSSAVRFKIYRHYLWQKELFPLCRKRQTELRQPHDSWQG